MIRLIASDLDGTLLNEEGMLSEKTAECIRNAQQAGILWVAATGRSLKTASELMRTAGVSPEYLLLNGAEFRKSDGTLIFQKSIEESCAQEIIQMLMEKKLDFEINTSVGDFSTDCEFCDTARPMPAVEKIFGAQIKIQKIFIFSEEQNKLKNIKEFLKKRQDITVTSSATWNIEITDRQANKGAMLEQIAEYYGWSKEEVLVFGDGNNDISMFEKFPHSRAVKNAVESLKKNAEKVIESNRDDVVAQEVCRLLQHPSFRAVL